MWHTTCIPRGSVSAVRCIVDRFLILERTFRHIPPFADSGYRDAFRRAHEELWVLAQALCALADPGLQSALDQTRRAILQEIHDHLQTGHAVLKQTTRPRIMRWYEHELTPEITHDPTIHGSIISRRSLKNLRALIRAQGVCVKHQLEINLVSFKS